MSDLITTKLLPRHNGPSRNSSQWLTRHSQLVTRSNRHNG